MLNAVKHLNNKCYTGSFAIAQDDTFGLGVVR